MIVVKICINGKTLNIQVSASLRISARCGIDEEKKCIQCVLHDVQFCTHLQCYKRRDTGAISRNNPDTMRYNTRNENSSKDLYAVLYQQ
ncbi:hypothetical protein ANTRET_LOCUS6094 [Anthophora retusa]